MALFRPEAIAHRSERLAGEVSMAIPASWQSIGFLMAAVVAVAVVFLALATYSRVEVASGIIVPDKGLIAINPTRVGTLTQLDVVEGQKVVAGQQLASVEVAEAQADGRSATQDMQQALDQQILSVAAKQTADRQSVDAQREQLAAQESGLRDQISEDDAQIQSQKKLVASAQLDLNAAESVARNGFISQPELRAREDALQQRQQALAQLEATRANQLSALSVAQRSDAQLKAQALSNVESALATRAALDQQRASLGSQGSYVLRAPVAGDVTALVAKTGETVSTDHPLLQIIPANAKLRAQLMIGTDAIGFIKPGQSVHLAIDAFPFEKFGTIDGRVLTVAQSPVQQAGEDNRAKLVYPAIVSLDAKAISAFGKRQPLVTGMTLTARIITARQSLLEWLLEPIFAVRRR